MRSCRLVRYSVVLLASLAWSVAFVGCASFSGSSEENPTVDAGSTAPTNDASTAPPPLPGTDGDGGGTTPDASCGPHQRASAAGCVCAPGFTDPGTGCVWTGVLVDPELSGAAGEAWAVQGGAFRVDGGVRFLSGGSASQNVVLPTLAEVGSALALRTVAYGRNGTGSVNSQEASFRAADVSSVHDTLSTCLGEEVMGRASTLRLSGRGRSLFTSSDWTLESVQIAPDPACPLPGQIPNGDFQSVGGWSTIAYEGATYEISGGHGVNGSVGAQLQNATACSAAITNVASVPSQPTALEYAVRGASAGTRYEVGFGARTETRTASPVVQVVHTCVPNALLGQVAPIRFAAASSCTLPIGFVVDDVRLVADPACADQPALPHADFESSALFDHWSVNVIAGLGSATRVSTATGFGLSLNRSLGCDFVQVRTAIDVPTPAAGNGLALRFDTVGPVGAGRANVSVGQSLYTAALPLPVLPIGASAPHSLCLQPDSYGALVPLVLGHDREGSIDCNANDPTSVVFDNFRLDEDPACLVTP